MYLSNNLQNIFYIKFHKRMSLESAIRAMSKSPSKKCVAIKPKIFDYY